MKNNLKCVFCLKEAELMLEGTTLCEKCFKTTDRYRSKMIQRILGVKNEK